MGELPLGERAVAAAGEEPASAFMVAAEPTMESTAPAEQGRSGHKVEAGRSQPDALDARMDRMEARLDKSDEQLAEVHAKLDELLCLLRQKSSSSKREAEDLD